MFKLFAFAAFFAYASAGLISLDDGYGLGGLGGLGGYGGYGGLGGIALAGHKVIAAPTIAVKAGATSYQNSNLLSVHPTPVITKAIAAPQIVTKVAAPIAVAAPSLSVVRVDGHYGLGGLGGISSIGGLGGLGVLGGHDGLGGLRVLGGHDGLGGLGGIGLIGGHGGLGGVSLGYGK